MTWGGGRGGQGAGWGEMFAKVRARGGSEGKRPRAGQAHKAGPSWQQLPPSRPAPPSAPCACRSRQCRPAPRSPAGCKGGAVELSWGGGRHREAGRHKDLGSAQQQRPAPTNPLSSPKCAQSENRVELLQLTQVGSPANSWSYSGVRSWRTMRSFITNWSISSCASSSVILPA